MEDKTGPAEPRPRQRARRRRPLRTIMLLDVIGDPDSRPAFLWAFGTLLLGMFAFHYLQGWSFIDSFYFCVITLATIGYGDFTPTTPVAKLFTVVYVINGIAILLTFFDRVREVRTRRYRESREDTSSSE